MLCYVILIQSYLLSYDHIYTTHKRIGVSFHSFKQDKSVTMHPPKAKDNTRN